MATKQMKNRIESNGHASAGGTIELKSLNRRKLTVTVVGDSPLMTNQWSKRTVQKLEDKVTGKGTSGNREARDPAVEMEERIYRDDKGRACIPGMAFKRAMVAAATSIGDIRNFSQKKMEQAFQVVGVLIPLRCSDPVMDVAMVSNAKDKSKRDVRYRPRFDQWECDITLLYNASVFSAEQIVNILNLSGFAVGVGEHRPECKGSNGMYSVKAGK